MPDRCNKVIIATTLVQGFRLKGKEKCIQKNFAYASPSSSSEPLLRRLRDVFVPLSIFRLVVLRFVWRREVSVTFEGEGDLRSGLSCGVALSSPELSSPAMARSSASSSLTDILLYSR